MRRAVGGEMAEQTSAAARKTEGGAAARKTKAELATARALPPEPAPLPAPAKAIMKKWWNVNWPAVYAMTVFF